jgi:hypothetical protein
MVVTSAFLRACPGSSVTVSQSAAVFTASTSPRHYSSVSVVVTVDLQWRMPRPPLLPSSVMEWEEQVVPECLGAGVARRSRVGGKQG